MIPAGIAGMILLFFAMRFKDSKIKKEEL